MLKTADPDEIVNSKQMPALREVWDRVTINVVMNNTKKTQDGGDPVNSDIDLQRYPSIDRTNSPATPSGFLCERERKIVHSCARKL